MNGVMMPSVSAGSSQREARVMCTPQIMVPSGAARAGLTAPSVRVVTRTASRARHFGTLMDFSLMESGLGSSPGTSGWRRSCAGDRGQSSFAQPARSTETSWPCPSGLLHHDRESGEASERRERTPLEWLIGEAHAREALEEGGNGELTFEPRERCSQAEVRAAAEGAMVHVPPRDVETIGLRVLRGVPVGGGKHGQHRLAAMDRAAADRHLVHGDASGLYHRRFEAQDLLDGVGDEGGLFTQLL